MPANLHSSSNNKTVLIVFGLMLWCTSLLSKPILNYDKLTLPDSVRDKRNSLIGLPAIFYLPETRFGIGGAGIYAFRFRGQPNTAKLSQVQAGLAYTQEKQWLLYLPFELYISHRVTEPASRVSEPARRKLEPVNGQYKLYGELGYYRYFYRFFGIGNDQSSDFQELYQVSYPRIRLTALRQFTPGLFAGLRYWFEDYRIFERDTIGQLIGDSITGSSGGITSGLGIVANYDTRDNLFFPSKGLMCEAVAQWYGRTIASDFNYVRYRFDIAGYHKIQGTHVLAWNLFAAFSSGNPPFNRMAMLGGHQKMRGYYLGRYRSLHMWTAQTEYRAPLFWRLGIAAFISGGLVANRIDNFQLSHFKYSYGAGIRFALDRIEKINLRLDAGFGQGSTGYYLTIGEAF